MEISRQIQEAGENSQQFMADTVIVNNGLTEQQVKEIIQSEISNVLKENQFIANDVAQARLNEFGNTLLPKLVKSEMLDAFKEPAVQILFKNAQKTAVCSQRKLDYELLSELLIHRTKKNNINRNLAISNAVEIIDKITEDALLVLTIVHAVIYFSPTSGDINIGLQLFDNLLGKILNGATLPDNYEWEENLEINRIMTFNTSANTKKLIDYWFGKFTSYSQIWIRKDSEEFKQISDELVENNIPMDIIIDNPLDMNFKTLKILQKSQVDDLIFNRVIGNADESVAITEKQKNVIKSIFENHKFKHNGNGNERTLFEQKANEFDNIRVISQWWDKNITKSSVRLNAIGRVIAHTNVKNIDPTLPDLD